MIIGMVNCLCVSACGRASASKRKLLDHEKICKTCRRAVKYRCRKCGKLFSSITYLKQHEIEHLNVRKFKCHICDKSFKRSGDCNRHVKEHSDVRNFRCLLCDETFKRNDCCIRHVERHLGIKSFQCMKCCRGFAQYSNARRHEEICCKNAAPVSHCSSGSGESDLTNNEVSDDEKMDANGY